jgi:hypothetical protein
MSPHLLRCQGLAVDNYSFALGRLTERSGDPASGEAGATSTFAQLGSNHALLGRRCVQFEVFTKVNSGSDLLTLERLLKKPVPVNP